MTEATLITRFFRWLNSPAGMASDDYARGFVHGVIAAAEQDDKVLAFADAVLSDRIEIAGRFDSSAIGRLPAYMRDRARAMLAEAARKGYVTVRTTQRRRRQNCARMLLTLGLLVIESQDEDNCVLKLAAQTASNAKEKPRHAGGPAA